MQCQNCDSKDQISIAGKTFCASCGTAAPVATHQNTQQAPVQPQAAPQSMITPTYQIDNQQPATSIPNPQPNNLADELTSNLQHIQTQPGGNLAAQSTNQPPIAIQQQAVASVQPSNIPAPSMIQPPAQQYPQPINTVPQQPTATPQVQPQPIVPSPQPVAMQAPVIVPDPSQVASAQMPSLPATQQPLPNTQPLGHTSETIGSEMSSLDLKDEQVFSDDQLKQLSSTAPASPHHPQNPFNASPVPSAPPAVARPMNDIRPAPANVKPIDTKQASLTQPVAQKPMNSQSFSPRAAPNPLANTSPQAQQANTLLGQVAQAKTKKSNKLKKHGGKAASVGLSLAGVILLGVYVWQINYPNLALKVASSKAGISASLPSYLPNGWKVSGDIVTNPGSVGYKLTSAGGDQSIAISEVRSDWDSQALAENYLSTNAQKYTALQAEGLTIYLYNDNQASWVNHGSWYKIEGNTKGLSQDQIIKMATSL